VRLEQRVQGARSPTELDRQASLPHRDQELGGIVEAREPDGGLGSEGGRQRLLEQRSPGHDRDAVCFGQPGGGIAGFVDVGHDRRQRLPGHEHGCRVDDVLARRTPVDGTADVGSHSLAQLLDEGHDWVPGGGACGREFGDVEPVGPAHPHDRVGMRRWNDTNAGCGPGQRASVSSIART